MFHKAIDLKFKEGTKLEVKFQDGLVKRYDMKVLFSKYPVFEALKDRELFEKGRLMGYGIIWNDDLDLETETIYCDGVLVEKVSEANITLGNSIIAARARLGISQKQLSEMSGIDQSDISKIERGVSNPSISTLDRLAQAFGGKLNIEITIPGEVALPV